MRRERVDVRVKPNAEIQGEVGGRKKVPPPFSWTGFIGFNTDNTAGLKRSGEVIWQGFIGENIFY